MLSQHLILEYIFFSIILFTRANPPRYIYISGKNSKSDKTENHWQDGQTQDTITGCSVDEPSHLCESEIPIPHTNRHNSRKQEMLTIQYKENTIHNKYNIQEINHSLENLVAPPSSQNKLVGCHPLGFTTLAT